MGVLSDLPDLLLKKMEVDWLPGLNVHKVFVSTFKPGITEVFEPSTFSRVEVLKRDSRARRVNHLSDDLLVGCRRGRHIGGKVLINDSSSLTEAIRVKSATTRSLIATENPKVNIITVRGGVVAGGIEVGVQFVRKLISRNKSFGVRGVDPHSTDARYGRWVVDHSCAPAREDVDLL
jgi:hypothetical protein